MSELKFESDNDEMEQEIDIKGLFFKYLYYWRLFLVSVILCCAAAFLYLRFKTPVYDITSCVYINIDENKAKSNSSPLASMEALGMLSMSNSFDNEIVKLQSRALIQKVVKDLYLYIEQFSPSTFGYSKPLYKNSPLQIYMAPQDAEKLKAPISLDVTYSGEKDILVSATLIENNEELQIEQHYNKFPVVLTTPAGVLTLSPTEFVTNRDTVFSVSAVISNPEKTARSYVGQLSVEPYSKTTTFANVSVKNTATTRGVDFINQLVKVYNDDANDEKNEVANKTADFIQERIRIINSELGTTESLLAEFKQKSGLTNLTNDAQLALQENSKYQQQLTENAIQIRLVKLLENYIHDPKNQHEVIPSNVGLQDVNLASVIDQYNAMVIERKSLLRTSSESNPAVVRLNTSIQAMKRNVQTTVNSVIEGLQLSQKDLNRQAVKFEQRISNAPKHEKEFIGISRQQEIQAALYIMLLEKREENAITLASTANNGRILENPLASEGPVAPKKTIILLAAFILGLAIPIGIIYIIDLLRYKIEGRKDVEELTNVTIVGEIPLAHIEPIEGKIVLRENKNELMEETFRRLRTNLLFMLEKNENVIFFTSTMAHEGKSFLVGNLAVSLAFLGKKVIVVGLDIRKPGLNKVFKLSEKAKGITDYLVNPEDIDLLSLIQHSHLSENLDILVGGTIPPNPTELVARDSLEKAIKTLKETYDYVLLDTAPIAMVTDTAIISRVADLCVYVCRADVTPKDDFCYVNELNQHKNFKKLTVALNGVDLSLSKYGKYGYHKYGYGKSYGYGYGYESK